MLMRIKLESKPEVQAKVDKAVQTLQSKFARDRIGE
jgi:hypothetical protein